MACRALYQAGIDGLRPEVSVDFRVVSYNIHGCVGRDRRRDADRIAASIRGFAADVVGLQEVDTHSGPGLDSSQMDYLPHATGLHAAHGPLWSRHHGHYGNLVLSAHPIVAVRHIDLGIGRHEPRGALDCDIALRDCLLRVVVTHFGLRPAERRAQAARLMAALAPDCRRPLVVMGDFNDWRARGPSLAPLHGPLGRRQSPPTYPAFFPLLPLDRIFVCPAEASVTIHAENSSAARIGSDHLPLHARVVIP